MVINAAYKTLRDSLLRARYNLTRHVAKQQPTSPPPNKVSDSVVKENENQRVEPLFRMKENENEPVEPLLDIFADLVRDLALHRGENIFEDLIEFLDGKAVSYNLTESSPQYCLRINTIYKYYAG